MKIKWEDPPPPNERKTVKGKMMLFVEEIKKRPGMWALYRSARNYTSARVQAYHFKTRFHGTQAVSRGKKVYVRWIGEEAGKDGE